MSNLIRSLIMLVMVLMSHLLICALVAGAGKSDERLEIPPALVDQTEYYRHGTKYVIVRPQHQPQVNKIIWPNGDGGQGLRLLSFEAARKLALADSKRRVPAGPDPLHHSSHSSKKNP